MSANRFNEPATYFCTSIVTLESGYLGLILNPVSEYDAGIEDEDRSFYLHSPVNGSTQLVSQVFTRNRGAFPARDCLVDIATDVKQMVIRSSSVSRIPDLPFAVSTQEISLDVESSRATAQLNYVRLDCDPGYLSAYQIDRAVNTIIGPPASGKVFPPDAMNACFLPGDSLPIHLVADSSRSRGVVRIDSISAGGAASLTVFTWRRDRPMLTPGTILERSKRWTNMSELDGRQRPREFTNTFAGIVSVTS